MDHHDERVDQLLQGVGRLEGKLDQFIALNLEKRVSSLESWRAKILGMCAAVAAIVTAAINIHPWKP